MEEIADIKYLGNTVMQREEMISNHLLITAAPDLLEALEDFVFQFENYAVTPYEEELLSKARTAIKKATNQQ